jgi:histidinol-phosphate aminotransferase
MIDVTRLLRPHLLGLTPYRSARDEFKGRAEVMLDANESPYPGQLGLNRYPDPMQTEVRQTLSGIHDVPLERIFIGNGSDEVLDLLFRAYCEPGRDKVLISPPTYGMYQTLAEINGVGIVRCDLEAETFQLPMPQIRPLLADPSLKLVFLCSPNNPTGNLLRSDDIEEILRAFQGLVVVDEAYIPYAEADSWVRRLDAYRNLVVV